MEKRLEELVERGVAALERLATDPVIEMEAAPPVCPFCNKFNPVVRVEEGADGPIAECVLVAQCTECNNTFYAMPLAWVMHRNLSEVREELNERAEHFNNGN